MTATETPRTERRTHREQRAHVAALHTVEPEPADVAGFDAFMRRYVAGLPVERAAVECV